VTTELPQHVDRGLLQRDDAAQRGHVISCQSNRDDRPEAARAGARVHGGVLEELRRIGIPIGELDQLVLGKRLVDRPVNDPTTAHRDRAAELVQVLARDVLRRDRLDLYVISDSAYASTCSCTFATRWRGGRRRRPRATVRRGAETMRIRQEGVARP
jgi:hypothetical protein